MPDVYRYKPQCIVTFYTETSNLVARATNDPESRFDDDVVQIQTVRDMGADAPTFTISLTRRKKWDQWVASNDLVIIQMQRPPEALNTVFYGIVDDCRKQVVMGANGTPQRVVQITGRGFNKALISFDIGIVPETDVAATNAGWLVSNGVMIAGQTPAQIAQEFWDNMVKKYVNYAFSSQQTLCGIANTNFTSRSDSKVMQTVSLVNFQGSMWAFMSQLTDSPFHELFWEINDAQVPEITLRPAPFNQDQWNGLQEFHIYDEDVVMDDYGRSDLETYTLFSIGLQTSFSANNPYNTYGTRPLWYKPYADKYGIRRLNVDCLTVAYGNSSDTNYGTSCVEGYQRDLFNWNIKNNEYYNGTLMVKGSNKYKVGTRLIYHSVEAGATIEFYVTAVSHNFTNYGAWTTTLSVTRGIDPTQRFTAPVNEYTEYTGIGWALYDPTKAEALLESQSGSAGSTAPSSDVAALQNSIVTTANGLLNQGIVYKFGSTNIKTNGSGDCSAFTQYVYKTAVNYDIGRTTYDQILKGTPVDEQNLQPGDLIFFNIATDSQQPPNHVGIYIGNNQFINLQDSGVAVQTLEGNSYWGPAFYQARRVVVPATIAGQPSAQPGRILNGFIATAYGGAIVNGGAGTWQTASGGPPIAGVTVAVDPSVIPLGTKLEITCPGYSSINGSGYIAQDTGGAIQGKHIDIYFNDAPPTDPNLAHDEMMRFGTQPISIKILG